MNTSETRPAWPTDWAGARGLRIGDAERNQASQALSEHFSLGRLSPDEFDLRQDLAWQAVSDTQLRALFADLPPLATTPNDAHPRAGLAGSVLRGDLFAGSGFFIALLALVTLGLAARTNSTAEIAMVGMLMFAGLGWVLALVHTLSRRG